jgi:enoyl-CoA hydratase
MDGAPETEGRAAAMAHAVSYDLRGPVATISMDDGKVNALTPVMLADLDAALDRALADRAVVVLAGRPGVFSAGFDLATLRAGGPDALGMVRGGFELAARILAFPLPVVVACTGHAVAMGVFLLLSGDYRVGAAGPYRITANEVAIGLTMPRAAVEICRQRLSPAYFTRAVMLAETFTPGDALAGGFLDQLVPAAGLRDAAASTAAALASLDPAAHAATKERARSQALAAIRSAIEADDADLRASA